MEKFLKQTVSHAIKSIVGCYIKKSLQVLPSRLAKLTNLMRFLKVSNAVFQPENFT